MTDPNMRARAEGVLRGSCMLSDDMHGAFALVWARGAVDAMLAFATTLAAEARADERERCARVAEVRRMRASLRTDIATAIRSTTENDHAE